MKKTELNRQWQWYHLKQTMKQNNDSNINLAGNDSTINQVGRDSDTNWNDSAWNQFGR